MNKQKYNLEKARLAAVILAGMMSDWTTLSNAIQGKNDPGEQAIIHAESLLKKCGVKYED